MNLLSSAKIFAILALMLTSTIAPANAEDLLADLSLEELITLEVTSVAKKPQKPEQSAAAISVITAEDLRRAGVTTLPEALRMAPGVEVVEVDGSITAVTIRGFNWRFSSKLLVLVDGRAIYHPTLTGLFWDQQLTPVENIQRIELVRGPGATMWGANAVNGVVNIVTKHAADTLKGAASVEASTHDAQRSFGRYGVQLGEIGALRLHGHHRNTPSLTDRGGDEYNDGTMAWQVGFRMDLEPTAKDSLTFQGDLTSSEFESTSRKVLDGSFTYTNQTENDAEEYYLLGRWVRNFSADNALTVQAYVDSLYRTEHDVDFEIDVYDLDLSHRFKLTDSFDVVWGANTRRIEDSVTTNNPIAQFDFEPDACTFNWTSTFVQGEFQLIPDRLRVTAGVKWDDNSFTGTETQPSIRAIWLEEDWALWGAISKAVRTPSRLERHMSAQIAHLPAMSTYNPSPLPVSITLNGSEDFQSENLVAYEVGVRKRFSNGAEFELTGYHHDYDELQFIQLQAPEMTFGQPFGESGPAIPVGTELPLNFNNEAKGTISGLEASLKTRVTSNWSIDAFLDVRDQDMERPITTDGDAVFGFDFSGDSPTWQASLRSDFDLNHNLDASLWLRHVSELEHDQADAYTDLDARLTWHVNNHVELSLIGENLLEPRRLEVRSGFYIAPDGYVERRGVLRLGLRF